MKYFITVSFLFVVLIVVAQQTTRGIQPSNIDVQSQPTNVTYAVVVGISDYQDPGIPDLRFADKDAEAFAAFLSSKAGGSLDQDHLKLLLNKQASMAQFANALDWLMEMQKKEIKPLFIFKGMAMWRRKQSPNPDFFYVGMHLQEYTWRVVLLICEMCRK